jgi:hypothetical protein
MLKSFNKLEIERGYVCLIPYAFIFYILYCSWKIASTYPLEFLSNWSNSVHTLPHCRDKMHFNIARNTPAMLYRYT